MLVVCCLQGYDFSVQYRVCRRVRGLRDGMTLELHTLHTLQYIHFQLESSYTTNTTMHTSDCTHRTLYIVEPDVTVEE